MLSFLALFVFTYFEVHVYKKHNCLNHKYLFYAVLFLALGAWFAVIGTGLTLFPIAGAPQEFSFLHDWRFWVYTGVEVIAMFTLNLNYINNSENHTAINIGVYSTVLFTPLLVLYGDPFFGFVNTKQIPFFSSLTNIYIYMGLVGTLLVLFFYDKIKTATLNKPFLLVITSVFLLISFYIETKLLQTYHYNFFIYAVYELFLAIVYFAVSKFNRENLSEFKLWYSIKISVYYIPIQTFLLVGVTLAPAELIILYRRISQVVVGLIFDKTRQNLKDIIVLSLFFILGIGLLYLSQN